MNLNSNSWYEFYKLAFRNKLDLFCKKLARNVFNNFIKNREDKGKIQYIITPAQEKELEDYDVKELVFIMDFYAISFDVKGHYLPEQKSIIVDIQVSPKMLLKNSQEPTQPDILSQNYEGIIQEIKYTIRHELEHAYYNNLHNYSEPSYKIPPNINNNIQYAQLTKKYLLDPSEMDAYIRELMLKAKNQRVLIDSLLIEMVNKKILEIAPESMKKEIENNTEEGIIYKNIINEILLEYRQRINIIYSLEL